MKTLTALLVGALAWTTAACGSGSERYPDAYLQAIHETYLTTSTHSEDRDFLRFGNEVCDLYDQGGTAAAVDVIASLASGQPDTRTTALLRATDFLCPVHRGDSSEVIAHLQATAK